MGWRQEQNPSGAHAISAESCSTLKPPCVMWAPSLGTFCLHFSHFLFSISDYLLVSFSFSSFSKCSWPMYCVFISCFESQQGKRWLTFCLYQCYFVTPFFFFFAWASFTTNKIYCLLLVAIFLFIEFSSPPHFFPCGSPFSIVLVLYFPPKILKQLLEDEAFNLIFHLQLALY